MRPRSALRSAAARALVPALAVGAALLGPGAGLAHETRLPVEGKKLLVRTEADPAASQFSFHIDAQEFLRLTHDPSAESFGVLVQGLVGGTITSTGLLTLDASRWEPLTSGARGQKKGRDELGYVYDDPTGARGGITNAVFKSGSLFVKGGGENWPWHPDGGLDEVWVHFRLEDEWYCANFSAETGANIRRNRSGYFLATNAGSPGECPEQVCGNGEVELGEDCDDGNLVEGDGCNNDCSVGTCSAETFESTFEAIQSVVFDSEIYGCTNGICHDAFIPEAGLDLEAGASYESLLGADGHGAPSDRSIYPRVKPGEPEQSFLYRKLAARVRDVEIDGSPMPFVGPALTEEHLEAVYDWIRGGAPRDGVVLGTQELLGTCLPPATPLKIAVPDPPAVGEGVQIQQTPWPLAKRSEDEICMATYFDLTPTELLPESARIECPERFRYRNVCSHDESIECTDDPDVCGEGNDCVHYRNRNNPDDECFAYHDQILYQDPQSHHSIIHMYAGKAGPGKVWGEWTYKFSDPENPLNGLPCDPTDVDPALGYNPGCSSEVMSTIACALFGPPDVTNLDFSGSGGGAIPQFSGSQEPYYEVRLADGVYDALPAKGIVIWNSHAFNLTDEDSTMDQYLNLEFARPEDQLYSVRGIFDARWIFAQNTPPFGEEEVCGSLTLPQGARLFYLSSHTHLRGVKWRVWAPPNLPCRPACPDHTQSGGLIFGGCDADPALPVCAGPRSGEPIYLSTQYSDPEQVFFEPPVALDSPDPVDRTYLYCSVYDNGATAQSPPVKRQSTSPDPPFPVPGIGGPCSDEEVVCYNDGPKRGLPCGGNDSFCDSTPDAGDGMCDACPARGGVTTEDEMFILLGSYYVP